jgi:hypothetical protein
VFLPRQALRLVFWVTPNIVNGSIKLHNESNQLVGQVGDNISDLKPIGSLDFLMAARKARIIKAVSPKLKHCTRKVSMHMVNWYNAP